MRYVLAVAETKNFTRAAQQCFVVQSALSHQIKALEKELGVALFARTSRRVELTAAGEAFLPHARACLEAAERAATEAAAAMGQVRGRLAVGVVPTVTALDIPATLQVFTRAHPGGRVVWRVGRSDDLASALRDGELDIAVLGLSEAPPPSGLQTRELARERLVIVVGRQHPLAARSALTLADLAQETFADFPAGSPGRAQSDEAFAAIGVTRQVAFEAMTPDQIIELVAAGLAIAFLPAAAVGSHKAVTTTAVTDGPMRVQYLAWRGFNPSPAATAFLRSIEENLDRPA